MAAPKKKKHGCLIAFLVILVLGIFLFTAFVTPGFLLGIGKKYTSPGPGELESLEEYARRLEDAGNDGAAAAVYDLIAKGGNAQQINDAHENNPVIAAHDEVEQARDIIKSEKEGDEE